MIELLRYCRRFFATSSSFTLFGIGGAIIPIFAYPLIGLAPISGRRKQEIARKLCQKVFAFFVKYMEISGVLTWEAHNLEKLNRPGLLVLANHPTLLDVVFLISFLPNADCVVKSSLRFNPAMRGFIKLTGFITNDTGEQLVDAAGESLNDGGCLVIFPEGTRTTPNHAMQLQRGAANIAVRTKTSITPITITCNPLALSKQHKWYHTARQRLHYKFQVNDDIDIQPYLTEHPSKAARHLTKDLKKYFSEELAE
ncbi:MAG: 1-acyl-sn-glycerol-3-phosphate acyltransferase [Cellvibrionaceae bacterium]